MMITRSQVEATAKYHRKMERVFRRIGQIANAESAKRAAEILEANLASGAIKVDLTKDLAVR